MPFRITLEMVISWIQFLVQMMEEKLSFGSSFKKHSVIVDDNAGMRTSVFAIWKVTTKVTQREV